MTKVGDILYRCKFIQPRIGPVFDMYRVVRLTPCGMWIRYTFHEGPEKGGFFDIAADPRWRSDETKFCSPTKEEALERYYYRKQSHLKHLRRKLADTEEQFALAAKTTHRTTLKQIAETIKQIGLAQAIPEDQMIDALYSLWVEGERRKAWGSYVDMANLTPEEEAAMIILQRGEAQDG